MKKLLVEITLIQNIIEQSIKLHEKTRELVESGSTEFEYLGLRFKAKKQRNNIVIKMPEGIMPEGIMLEEVKVNQDLKHPFALWLAISDVLENFREIIDDDLFKKYCEVIDKHSELIIDPLTQAVEEILEVEEILKDKNDTGTNSRY